MRILVLLRGVSGSISDFLEGVFLVMGTATLVGVAVLIGVVDLIGVAFFVGVALAVKSVDMKGKYEKWIISCNFTDDDISCSSLLHTFKRDRYLHW